LGLFVEKRIPFDEESFKGLKIESTEVSLSNLEELSSLYDFLGKQYAKTIQFIDKMSEES